MELKGLYREDVIEMLKAKQEGMSLRSFAESMGISAAYLSDVLRGRRDPGPAILDQFGLKRAEQKKIVYVRRSKAKK